MEKTALVEEAFWKDPSPCVMFNTLGDSQDSSFAESEVVRSLPGHFFFMTSGTTGESKWVAISKDAMLASAAAVVDHLGVENGDRWFQALPVFHVGGMSLYARAYLTEGEVIEMEGKWDAGSFVDQVKDSGAHWVSLVPTQLVDVVKRQLVAPETLKGCIVGGGSLDSEVEEQAIALGWPVLASYGMTEAGSQIATATEVGGALKLLPHVQVRLNEAGCLEWTGSSRLSGYVQNGEFVACDGWVSTSDRVELDADKIVFVARADRTVKVLGELVDVDLLESQVNQWADQEVVLSIQQDARRGVVLVPVVEEAVSEALKRVLASHTGLNRLELAQVRPFPRNTMGKVMKREV